MVDTATAVKMRLAYTPYGAPMLLNPDFTTPYSGTDYKWETRFASYRWDTESELYAVRNRAFHSVAGIWTTRDLILAVNRYEYCVSCPLIDTDPLGLEHVVTIVSDNTTESDLGNWKKERDSWFGSPVGDLYEDVGSIGELVAALKKSYEKDNERCITHLNLSGHGTDPGAGMNFRRGSFSELSPDKAFVEVSRYLCGKAVVWLHTCTNMPAEIQAFANKLRRKVCGCPGHAEEPYKCDEYNVCYAPEGGIPEDAPQYPSPWRRFIESEQRRNRYIYERGGRIPYGY